MGKLTTETLLQKIRTSNNLIATLLAYGFGWSMVGHVLGAVTIITGVMGAVQAYRDLKG